jgi:hypothetical protein
LMKAITLVVCLSVAVLSGCAGFQTGSEVLHGRQAFLVGNHEAALAYFHSAAQKDPNYTYGTALRQGIWSLWEERIRGRQVRPSATNVRAGAGRETSREDIARLYWPRWSAGAIED